MKHILIVLGLAALFIGGWWGLHRGTGQNPFSASPPSSPPSAPTSTQTVSPTSTAPAVSKKPAVKKSGATATPKPSTLQAVESYQDALALYGSTGYRYQFTTNCQATPGTITMKSQHLFMLDNRDGMAHVVGVGTQTYMLGAYGFAVASAPKAAGSYSLLCDGNTRATVSVQP